MNIKHLHRQDRLVWAFFALLPLSQVGLLAQQQVADTALIPVATTAKDSVAQKPDAPPAEPVATEDKRILGVLPNYRTADGTKPFHPISAKYKLTIASKD